MQPQDSLYCPLCSDIRELEIPDCGDSPPDSERPERACVVCGTALFVDPVTSSRRPARAA